MYIPKYFEAFELVDKDTFEKFQNHPEVIFKMFDDGLLQFADLIKEHYNKTTVTINNWYWGGAFQWSGLRTPESPDYSKGSMHSVGKALDLKFPKIDVAAVRRDLMDGKIDCKGLITRVEIPHDNRKMGWLHVDTKPTNKEGIYFFKP